MRLYRTGQQGILEKLPPMPPEVVADVACGEAFHKACKVRLFPDQWQTWLVFRTLRDQPETGDIADMAHSFVARALDGEILHDVQAWVGPATPAGHAPQLPELPDFVRLDERGREQSFGQACPGWAAASSLAPGPYVAVVIRFVYRGVNDLKPWAARKSHFVTPVGELVPTACPFDADWILDSTFRPLPGEMVPDRPAIIPIPVLPDIKPVELGKSIGKALAAPILLAALVLGVVILKD